MSFIFFEHRAELQDALIILIFSAALYWGGKPERIIALCYFAAFKMMDTIYHTIWGVTFQLNSLDLFHAFMDGTAFVLFLLVALFANRFYTMLIAAFQLLSVFAHLVRELSDTIEPIAYAVMVIAPSWGIIISLGFGVLAHVRRKKKFGEYRDWLKSEPHLPGLSAKLAIMFRRHG